MQTADHDLLPSVSAWILAYSGRGRAAIGEFELVHILDRAPTRFPVPRAPRHCHEVMLWEQQVLPYVDLAMLDRPARMPHGSDKANAGSTIVAIVGYQTDQRQPPRYGALKLCAIPKRASVSNDSACRLPEDIGAVAGFACSCFRHPEFGAVPVLDLPRIFSPERSG